MVSTNFDLAPPVVTVDGLVAVPIDIQQITASLVFDGAISSGSGDATLNFTMGPQDGNPIFDLRQTITAAWLDGSPMPVYQLDHHDFGGGANAELRIVESVLAAGSSHTLRVTYSLGPPQASAAGSYQPAMSWNAGPRLAFNFGFTDLGAGRYLEAWVPANLIFDQYELILELQVLNTAIDHTPVSNGTVAALGANHWSVAFPDRFTAFSPLLELRATDTLTSLTDTTTLPSSGIVMTIEAWKLASSSINLVDQINNLKTWLADNENSTGDYLHGNRYVAFMHIGGMEYEGGTTTGTGALRHEAFHSWWGRGLKPASQPDAWWDEAWTVYNDSGASGASAFNFADPPVELSPRNPWVRITAPGSYSAGRDFFEGAASMIGVANLNSMMRDFYSEGNARPATTTGLEEFLVCRSGAPLLVDAFHRFVFGFGEPSPAPDLWMRDHTSHSGADEWSGAFWNSPDLWIRNADDGGTDHQPPEYGQDNWFYARIRNRRETATAQHFLVTFNVKPFAGTQFQYPDDFLPCVAAAAGFALGSGETTIVKARWPASQVPPEGTHTCLLATVITQSDHPAAGLHVWEHNNLAQKNLTVVDLEADDWLVLPFVITSFGAPGQRCGLRPPGKRVARQDLLGAIWQACLNLWRTLRPAPTQPAQSVEFQLELVRPKGHERLEAGLLDVSGDVFKPASLTRERPALESRSKPVEDQAAGLDCGGGIDRRPGSSGKMWTSRNPDAVAAQRFQGAVEVLYAPGQTARTPVLLRKQQQRLMGLRLHVPKDANPGDIIYVDLVKRHGRGKRMLGGLAVEIHVR